ncbi:hypothetical protein CTI12_AA426150 [Artemisia annua]|uniref:non-specific serine/threonine protein kinase n=1 Tax=Artemisia annua TaxID=35608 RepID=A0A2U1M2N5_ARTAN|nr:hypothetical protein CTI12_AA426150 [Artemisia annua]
MDIKILPQQYILKRWTREAKNDIVQDVKGKVVHEDANLSATQRYRSLCSKLVKLASKASEYEETYEFAGTSIDELCKNVQSMYVNLNKLNSEDVGVGPSLSKDKDTRENIEPPTNVCLKKKVGQKAHLNSAEYAYTLQVDEKSDIYSYGVLLMELISGKRSVDSEFREGNSIVDWVRSKKKEGNLI